MLSAFFAAGALVGLTATAAAATSTPAPKVVDLGDNTFSITCVAQDGFHRDIHALNAQALEEASAFCAARGKLMKEVDSSRKKPWFMLGYCSATVVFKALDAGDPELAAEPVSNTGNAKPAYAAPNQRPQPTVASQQPAAIGSGQQPAAAAPGKVAVSGDLYTALLQLDDLRKKGILTEEEFQSEKQKVLKRSQ